MKLRALVSIAASVSLALALSACGSNAKSSASPTSSPNDSPHSGSLTPSTTVAGSAPTTEASANTITVTVANGKVTPSPTRHSFKKGAVINITVTSDKAEEIHVHGYDLKKDLDANVAGTVTVTATIPGVFDVELEHSSLKLLELEVS